MKEAKEYKEEYVENRLKFIKEGWNNMRKKIEDCEKDIIEIKENKVNVNLNKRNERKENEENMENIDMDEWEEINTNKKKGNKGNKYKKMQEYIKDKIENKKLKICKICLGRNILKMIVDIKILVYVKNVDFHI